MLDEEAATRYDIRGVCDWHAGVEWKALDECVWQTDWHVPSGCGNRNRGRRRRLCDLAAGDESTPVKRSRATACKLLQAEPQALLELADTIMSE